MKLGGLLSVALSRGSPQVDVIHHSCPMESGLSSNIAARDHPTDSSFLRIDLFQFNENCDYLGLKAQVLWVIERNIADGCWG